MEYILEKYKDNKRFNAQYNYIYEFLKNNADVGYNEDFHWGRFEWMMEHPMLDVDKLNKIGIFKDEKGKIVGIVTYDTSFSDNTYILHSINSRELLLKMISYAHDNYSDNNKTYIVANSKDLALIEILKELKYSKTDWKDSVLELNLDNELKYKIQSGYHISQDNQVIDLWQYELVIYKGFDHKALPKRTAEEDYISSPNTKENLRVFVINEKNEYVAHCGVWYTEGETAYIEPVVTIPDCRNKGFAKAAIYEALNRAKKLGAKRAVVLSTQEFYYKIGFKKCSEFIHFEL